VPRRHQIEGIGVQLKETQMADFAATDDDRTDQAQDGPKHPLRWLHKTVEIKLGAVLLFFTVTSAAVSILVVGLGGAQGNPIGYVVTTTATGFGGALLQWPCYLLMGWISRRFVKANA